MSDEFDREPHPDTFEVVSLTWDVLVSLNHNLRVLANETKRIADALEQRDA